MDIDLGERVVRVDDGLTFYKSLTRLQAMIRGIRVRKHLQETRRQFEALFNEVEERSLLQLTWPRELLCAPVLSYPSCGNTSKCHNAPSSTCDDATTSETVSSDKQVDDCLSETRLNGSCSCCAGHRVAPHELGQSSVVGNVATTKATVSEENSDVCNSKETCVISTDTDDAQNKPMHDCCEVDGRSVNVSPPPMTQNDTRLHPHNSEQHSKPQQGSARTDPQLDVANVDVVDGDEPSHDTSSFRHKTAIVSPGGCGGQEPHPGQGGWYSRDDSIARNASSVWDSFDGSTVRESRESLEGEDRRSLEERKTHITMELLWIQQAIESRKQYLCLKTRMIQTAS